MLSIILCSINPDYLQQVKESIKETVGIPYELLVYDNRTERRGLCEIYNEMAGVAAFPFLCFLHEDILLQTPDWGLIVIRLFHENPNVGVIGVAGGRYKSRAYSGWYSGDSRLDCFNITHRIYGVDEKMVVPNASALMHEVICIDGVFMGCRKDLWHEVRFNDRLLKGFHFYDIDFSLRASTVQRVLVTMEIDIIHVTQGGDYGDKWVDAAILFHEENKFRLPSYARGILPYPVELNIAQKWLDRLKNERIRFRKRLTWIGKQHLYIHPTLWYPVLRFLLYRPLRLQAIHKYFRKKASHAGAHR